MPIVSFGALNPDGKDCPVPPTNDTILGIPTHTPETWAAPGGWCDCMYPAAKYPDLNRRCKWYVGNGPAGFFDPTPPWTVTGKISRGLSDDAISRAITEAANKLKAAGTNLVTGTAAGGTTTLTGGTTVTTGQLSPPAGAGGPTGLIDSGGAGFQIVTRTGSQVTRFVPPDEMLVRPVRRRVAPSEPVVVPQEAPPQPEVQQAGIPPMAIAAGIGLALLWLARRK